MGGARNCPRKPLLLVPVLDVPMVVGVDEVATRGDDFEGGGVSNLPRGEELWFVVCGVNGLTVWFFGDCGGV